MRVLKQILTKHSALMLHGHANGVSIERHSWLTRRSARKPDAVNVACFSDEELLPLSEALREEHERRKAAGT